MVKILSEQQFFWWKSLGDAKGQKKTATLVCAHEKAPSQMITSYSRSMKEPEEENHNKPNLRREVKKRGEKMRRGEKKTKERR